MMLVHVASVAAALKLIAATHNKSFSPLEEGVCRLDVVWDISMMVTSNSSATTTGTHIGGACTDMPRTSARTASTSSDTRHTSKGSAALAYSIHTTSTETNNTTGRESNTTSTETNTTSTETNTTSTET
eukprot:Lankesteria_metandrocarpae@DN2375_c0_g1_i1.p1